MRYHADLHVHSPYSRGVSPKNDLFHLAYWARRKGIAVMGTGDFTYPAWLAALENELVGAEPGFFRLRDDLDQAVDARLEGPCRGSTRFVLSVEISTIYKKDGRRRAIHHLVYVPDFAAARKVVTALAKIGNIQSDGRPILGLDSRHLLEIVLESGPGSFLVPAHVWTPWFGLFGSASGFDAVEACYGDLAPHIFALETGLSSDPQMNYRISKHDRYHLLSCSDAHSAPKLGREATIFDTGFDFFSMRRALETGDGLAGTIEFFPEEGKYHLDGHRDCKVRLSPAETREIGGICSVCRKPLTVGVLSRVEDLADRDIGFVRPDVPPFRNLVPLLEVLAELLGKNVDSPKVQEAYRGLLTRLGSEFFILEDAPLDLIQKADSSMLAEGIRRMREKQIHAEPGFDGENGVIHLFSDAELRAQRSAGLFVDLGRQVSAPKPAKPTKEPTRKSKPNPKKEKKAEASLFALREKPEQTSVLDGLDDDQKAAAAVVAGPLLVVAGPGTGKTRTLTVRIAFLVKETGVSPENILAITFTRRAADEMRERLGLLLGEQGGRVATFTFHALGLHILQKYGGSLEIKLVSEAERVGIVERALSISTKKATKLVAKIGILKRRDARRLSALERDNDSLRKDSELDRAWEAYEREMDEKNLVDFEDLVGRSVLLLESKPEVLEQLRSCYPYISVDEFQDVDERQYRLLLLLAGDTKNVCAIGDPDQAIYGFRGSDVSFFFRFREDYPATSVVRLGKNYRSTRAIVDAALSVIAASPTLGERVLRPISQNDDRIGIHTAKSEAAEAEWVVLTIERLLGGTSMFSRDSRRVGPGDTDALYSFSDFAILYRTEAQAEVFGEALKRSGMPFQRRTHARVAERGAAMAIMEALGSEEPTIPLVEALAAAAEKTRKGLVSAELAEPQGAEEEPNQDHFTMADVDAALAVLHRIAERSGWETKRFRYEVLIEVEVDTWDGRAERISLLTLHASKGLEFAVVFLVGCEDGILPLRFAGRPDEVDEAEERRLFFVGMTRAKERLFLSRSERRKRHGKVHEMKASPFLGEIEARLMDDDEDGEGQKELSQMSKKRKKQMTLF